MADDGRAACYNSMLPSAGPVSSRLAIMQDSSRCTTLNGEASRVLQAHASHGHFKAAFAKWLGKLGWDLLHHSHEQNSGDWAKCWGIFVPAA